MVENAHQEPHCPWFFTESRCAIGTTERRLNLGSSFLDTDSQSLSLRLTLHAVLLHVLYRGAELRRASTAPDSLHRTRLSGRIAYRLLVVCALQSCSKSNFTAPRRVSSIVAGTGGGTPRIGEHAVAACRQVCQRTNVPKNRCAVAVSSRTAPLGKRHWAAPLSGDSTALPASPGGPLPSTRNSGKPKGMDLIGAVFLDSYP